MAKYTPLDEDTLQQMGFEAKTGDIEDQVPEREVTRCFALTESAAAWLVSALARDVLDSQRDKVKMGGAPEADPDARQVLFEALKMVECQDIVGGAVVVVDDTNPENTIPCPSV